MGDILVNIENGWRIDQPGTTYSAFVRVHLGSVTTTYDVSDDDWTALVRAAANPTKFATQAAAKLPWYARLTDADTSKTPAQNATNAKNRLRRGFFDIRSST